MACLDAHLPGINNGSTLPQTLAARSILVPKAGPLSFLRLMKMSKPPSNYQVIYQVIKPSGTRQCYSMRHGEVSKSYCQHMTLTMLG